MRRDNYSIDLLSNLFYILTTYKAKKKFFCQISRQPLGPIHVLINFKHKCFMVKKMLALTVLKLEFQKIIKHACGPLENFSKIHVRVSHSKISEENEMNWSTMCPSFSTEVNVSLLNKTINCLKQSLCNFLFNVHPIQKSFLGLL